MSFLSSFLFFRLSISLMSNHPIRPSPLLCLLISPHFLFQMMMRRRRRRKKKTPVLQCQRTTLVSLLFLLLAPGGRYGLRNVSDWTTFIRAWQKNQKHLQLLLSHLLLSSPLSICAYWRIPVLWLRRPLSFPPPHRLPLRTVTVALVHSCAHPAPLLLNISTRSAPLLMWSPVISLL